MIALLLIMIFIVLQSYYVTYVGTKIEYAFHQTLFPRVIKEAGHETTLTRVQERHRSWSWKVFSQLRKVPEDYLGDGRESATPE